MKPVQFLGDSLKRLRDFPEDVRVDADYQIDKIQHGQQSDDSSRCPQLARVSKKLECEIGSGAYRVIYTARLTYRVVVLHVFAKKTQATSVRDLEIAKRRFNELMGGKND